MNRWSLDENAIKRLMLLMDICSPSGEENDMAMHVHRELASMGIDAKSDVIGNVFGALNPQEESNIALVAHMDTIGLQIVKILDNGLLVFRRMGTLLLPLAGTRVTILTNKHHISGVVGYDPLTRNVGDDKVSDDDLWIDIGTDSRFGSEQMVQVGDYAVFESHCSFFGDHKISGAGLDDRIGVFVALEAMRLLRSINRSIGVSLVGTVQEEIGLRGAKVVYENIKPTCALVIDVDFATDLPTGTDKMVGMLQLGKGVGISRKATCHRELQKTIIDVARESKIPYQINVGRNIVGGTDADSLQLQKGGIMTANISIPCRYMHSANEVCDLRDVESAINLLVETVISIEHQRCASH
jgi:endoglucanase